MAVKPRTENGWGSVFNGGITGGAGGIEIEFTDFVEMWIWMRNNRTTPAKITYTGNDFSREGFDYIFPNATFSNSARFEIDGLANKTIRASQGQIINWCEIRFRNSNNCIWENWHHKDSSKDLIAIINDSTNIWIRHCTLNHNVFNQIDSPTEKSIDIGWRSDYIAVTDCIIMNNDKTFLISFSNDEPNDVGKMKVTIRRTKFLNCIQRKPRGRYGRIGIEYCVLDDRDLTVFSKSIGVGKLTRFFTYRNTFRGGGTVLFEDRLSIDNFPIEDAGALKSVENVITGSYSSGMNEIRPELVTWDSRTEPNYTLEDWTVEEASAWVEQWAGATMHLMEKDIEIMPEPHPEPTPEPTPEPEPQPEIEPQPQPEPEPNTKPENHPSNQKGNNGKGKKK
jgi:pectate lyase